MIPSMHSRWFRKISAHFRASAMVSTVPIFVSWGVGMTTSCPAALMTSCTSLQASRATESGKKPRLPMMTPNTHFLAMAMLLRSARPSPRQPPADTLAGGGGPRSSRAGRPDRFAAHCGAPGVRVKAPGPQKWVTGEARVTAAGLARLTVSGWEAPRSHAPRRRRQGAPPRPAHPRRRR